jgi:hypothetical protein
MSAPKIVLHRLKRGEDNWAAGTRWVAMVYDPARKGRGKGKGYTGEEFTSESEAVIWGAKEAARLAVPLFKEDPKGREVEVNL